MLEFVIKRLKTFGKMKFGEKDFYKQFVVFISGKVIQKASHFSRAFYRVSIDFFFQYPVR